MRTRSRDFTVGLPAWCSDASDYYGWEEEGRGKQQGARRKKDEGRRKALLQRLAWYNSSAWPDGRPVLTCEMSAER